MDNIFCHEVCKRTRAVVVSVDYCVAPQHIFPAAHEDCEDAVTWLLANVKEKFHANSDCLTVSGFSAGANAMMVAASRARAAVGFYGAVRFNASTAMLLLLTAALRLTSASLLGKSPFRPTTRGQIQPHSSCRCTIAMQDLYERNTWRTRG